MHENHDQGQQPQLETQEQPVVVAQNPAQEVPSPVEAQPVQMPVQPQQAPAYYQPLPQAPAQAATYYQPQQAPVYYGQQAQQPVPPPAYYPTEQLPPVYVSPVEGYSQQPPQPLQPQLTDFDSYEEAEQYFARKTRAKAINFWLSDFIAAGLNLGSILLGGSLMSVLAGIGYSLLALILGAALVLSCLLIMIIWAAASPKLSKRSWARAKLFNFFLLWGLLALLYFLDIYETFAKHVSYIHW